MHFSHTFTNSLFKEVSYNMMLKSQRQTLHQKAAEHYEKKFGEQLRNYYALLIYHFMKAEDLEKAEIYSKKLAACARWKAVGRMMTGVLFMKKVANGPDIPGGIDE